VYLTYIRRELRRRFKQSLVVALVPENPTLLGALAVSRTIASVGACIVGAGTSSRRMSPTPPKTTAFILDLPPGS